jgi:aminobenzoyl-glutamate transport protein
MVPYTLAFLVFWTVMLVLWMALGLPLGSTGPLDYVPPA